jgi:hypothetical protein
LGLRASCMSAASTRARRTSLQTRLSFFNDVLNRVFTARARGKSWCGALCRITAGVDFGRVRWGADTLSPAPKAGASAAEDKPRSRTSWWSRRGRTNAVHALLAARRAHTVLTPPSAPDGAQHASPAESRRLEAGAGAPTPASPAIALSPAARSAAQPRCIAFSYRKCSVTVVQLPRCLQKKRCQSCICTRLETCVLGNRKCSFQLLSYQCDSLSA